MKTKKKNVHFTANKGGKYRRFKTFKRRAVFIFSRLLHKGFITTKEIADEFGQSPRNALRDLDPLKDEGIIKETAPRSGKWEYDRASHSFLKLDISDRDSSILAFLYKFSKVFGGDLNKNVLGVIDKLFVIEDQEYPFFMITQKINNPASKMTGYKELCDAIIGHYKINLTYPKNGAETTVKASPFAIIFCDGLSYLGYIPEGMGKQLRTLRSSHILKVEPLPDETFQRPEWARKAMKEAKNIWFSPARNKILLKADNSVKEYFDGAEHFPCQKIVSEGPDSFTIEARYAHLNEVVPTILRFLPAIKVLEPAEVREEVARRIKEYKA